MFTDAERAYFAQMRALTIQGGREVLIGLTAEETAEYLELGRQNGGADQAATERYLALYDKHENARLGRLGKEIKARIENALSYFPQ